MTKNTDITNTTNYFLKSENIDKDLGLVIGNDQGGIFGLELILTNEGVVSKTLITPSFLRIRPDGVTHREADLEGFTIYEGYLSEPFFLPLYGGLEGPLVDDIASVELDPDEEVRLQLLFKKRYNWHHQGFDMYESYLKGNGRPTPSSLGRSLQEKVLNTLNKLSGTVTEHEYSYEVEDKLVNDGYAFQLRVAVNSSQPQAVKRLYNEILRGYSGQNSLRLLTMKDKFLAQQFQDCVITGDRKYQILGLREIGSIVGGVKQAPIKVLKPQIQLAPMPQPTTQIPEVVSVPKPQPRKVPVGSAINLLPFIPIKDVDVDDELPNKLAYALKRVGLVPQAKLYDANMTTGIRLTMVECQVPKSRVFSQIKKKGEDIQVALGVTSLGVEQGSEPDTVRFTIPNEDPAVVSLREIIESESFQEFKEKHPLAIIVGLDEMNNPIYLSLAKLVHLLVAGTTGSGKSVFINSLALTLLLTHDPDELRLLMIDPKKVELQHFRGLPHVDDVITDMGKAYGALDGLCVEMDRRYTAFADAGVKNIQLYNEKSEEKMPYIVCVIDEYADLKMKHKEVEDLLQRMGQLARAAGIHLIVATQRPDVKVIGGAVKAVIPAAISFYLKKTSDYMTVFGSAIPLSGNLLGKGDGMMQVPDWPREFQRFQSPIVCPNENEEEALFQQLYNHYGVMEEAPIPVPTIEDFDEDDDDSNVEELEGDLSERLEVLKGIIATTRETRTKPLREALGVKNTTLQTLMNALVQQGWLIKHPEKQKGYEIVAEDYVLAEYRVD